MKKRVMTLLLVLVLTVSFSVTAFAKPSPGGGDMKIYGPNGEVIAIIKIDEEQFTGSFVCDHGDSCEGTVEIITKVLSQFRDVVDGFDINKLIAGTEYAGKEWTKMFEMELIAKDCVEFPITLSIDKKDWAEGEPLVVHYLTEKEEWEIVKVTEDDEVYLLHFDSCSPVLFYQALDQVETIGPVEEEGNNNVMLPVIVVAVAAAAGAVLMKKKKSA